MHLELNKSRSVNGIMPRRDKKNIIYLNSIDDVVRICGRDVPTKKIKSISFETIIPEERCHQHVDESASRHQLADIDIPDGQAVFRNIDGITWLEGDIQLTTFEYLVHVRFEILWIIHATSDDDGSSIALVSETTAV